MLVLVLILGATTKAQTFNLNGSRFTVLIPPDMRIVRFTPQRLETSNKMSILSYKIALGGQETIYGLHWNIYVSDKKRRLLRQDSWWDRGEWKANSEIESETVFEYDGQPGTILTIILKEMETDRGVSEVADTALEHNLRRVLATGKIALLKATFVAHENISPEEYNGLVRRSLDATVSDENLRRFLLIQPKTIVNLVASDPAYNVPNVALITSKEVEETIKQAQSITYFEYCCLEIRGKDVTVILNYHTPRVRGNSYCSQMLWIGPTVQICSSEQRVQWVANTSVDCKMWQFNGEIGVIVS